MINWKRFQTTTMVKLNRALRDSKLPEIIVPKAGSRSSEEGVDPRMPMRMPSLR